MLTAEGAAGDLAAAVTLAEAPVASVPRISYALGRADYTPAVINAAVRHLVLEIGGATVSDLPRLDEAASSIAAAVEAARAVLVEERFTADGFATLAAFLFDASDYLRRPLDAPDSAERAMALVEVVSALSLAAAYRITHPGAAPADARIGFAQLFRRRLTETTPLPITPRPRRDAVLVMTCHGLAARRCRVQPRAAAPLQRGAPRRELRASERERGPPMTSSSRHDWI